MKNPLRLFPSVLAASMIFSSCAYDPYYSSAGGSYNSGYSGGYGDGYGYGGSNFSTSFFVSTGDPRWGYDPYCYSYYDYHSRRYYDPYLHGYYPVGYRPPVVVGVPHPYGWRPGRGYCPPPSRVRDVTVVNYRNRVDAYRGSSYDWARQVRQRPVTERRPAVPDRSYQGGRTQEFRPGQQSQRQDAGRPYTDFRPGGTSRDIIRQSDRSRGLGAEPDRRANRQSQSARPPANYNTPVTRPAPTQTGRRESTRTRAVESRSPQASRQGAAPQERRAAPARQPQAAPRQASPEPRSRRQEASPGRREEARPDRSGGRGAIRSLGQG